MRKEIAMSKSSSQAGQNRQSAMPTQDPSDQDSSRKGERSKHGKTQRRKH